MTWAFTHPWMLAGLAAVGLPVLIHFLTRSRPRRIAFPPFRFLVEAGAGQQAVHRLRTILLLIVRTLAVLALVLLFARPFLKPTGPNASGDAARRAVLVLDASLSMRAAPRGVSLFARAQAEAADVLRALESGSEAAIILMGATPQPLLPALSRNLPALHSALTEAQPTFEQGDPAAALALATKLLGGAGTIYILSDFQKSNWEATPELPAGTVCRLRPVTKEPIENVALTAVRLVPAEPVSGEPVEVLATVFNGTPRPRRELVRLELGDLTQELPVTVPPFGSAEAAFQTTFLKPGPLSGQAILAPDDLREDNTRHVSLRVHQALHVLLISDSDSTEASSAAFFVTRALAPSAAAAPGLSLVRRHSQDADRGVLETADVFLLVPPATLSGEAVEIVERRVKAGARYLAFLDGPTAPRLVPPAFVPPFHLLAPTRSPAGDPLIPGPLKLFSDGDAADFAALRFHRHYLNQVLTNRSQDVLFSFPDGSAALTLSRVDQGAAAFANIPLSLDGGGFVGHPMFPAMLHELLRALRRGTDEPAVMPGAAWTFDVQTSGDGSVTVTDPEARPVEAKVVASGRTTRLALPNARRPGIYAAKQDGQLLATAAVNLDPRESDPRPMPLENLKAGAGATATVVRDEDDLIVAGQNRPLWPMLAGTLAGLLALEMALLAWWRQRPAAKAIPPVSQRAETILQPQSAPAGPPRAAASPLPK